MAQLPAEGDEASQSPINFSAPYKGSLNGPSCPGIKHFSVMAAHQDEWSMELLSHLQMGLHHKAGVGGCPRVGPTQRIAEAG